MFEENSFKGDSFKTKGKNSFHVKGNLNENKIRNDATQNFSNYSNPIKTELKSSRNTQPYQLNDQVHNSYMKYANENEVPRSIIEEQMQNQHNSENSSRNSTSSLSNKLNNGYGSNFNSGNQSMNTTLYGTGML
jgi:hypothetical protein